MYSQAFDHMHGRAVFEDNDDGVYTDPDSLQTEVLQDRLAKRRSKGRGTGFKKKQNDGLYLDLEGDDDMMGQSQTSEYIDVMDVNPRQNSPPSYERSMSDGHILQGRQLSQRGLSQPFVSLAGHTNEESTDYCYAVEPGAQPPELRKRPQVPKFIIMRNSRRAQFQEQRAEWFQQQRWRTVSVKDDYSQPPDRLSTTKSQDYTEPYQSQGNKSPTKNPSGPPDPGIYEFAKEPIGRGTVTSGGNPYSSTYNHITSGFNKAKLDRREEESYDHLNTFKRQQAQAGNISQNHQPKVPSPTHKHFPANLPPSRGSGPANMQACGAGQFSSDYQEPWDTHAGQKKLTRLLDRAEKTDERRQSMDKQTGQTEQNIARNVRRSGATRNPSASGMEVINDTSNPDACNDDQSELYETSWGPNIKRNSLEKVHNTTGNTHNTTGNTPKTEEARAPVKHAPIPANYEDAWDLPEKQKEFEEKLEQARKKRTSEGQIRGDDSEVSQAETVRSPESKFPPEVTRPPQLPAPRMRPMPAKRDNCQRSDSCRSLGALAEKIDKTIPLQDQIFYHGAIKRSDAEKMLLVFKDGSYLIRRSETCRRDFSLTLKGWNGIAMHMKIVSKDDGTYVLGENSPPFNTIPEMVDYYTTHELPVQNAERICLLYPIPC